MTKQTTEHFTPEGVYNYTITETPVGFFLHCPSVGIDDYPVESPNEAHAIMDQAEADDHA